MVVGCFASLEGNDLYNELWRQVDNEKEKTDNGGGKGISIRGGGVRKVRVNWEKNKILLFQGLNNKDRYYIENGQEIGG